MKTEIDVFAWGEDSILRSWGGLLECADNGRFFVPPVNLYDLAELLKTGLHHASALQAKLNILNSTFVPTKLLARSEFAKLAFNFLVTGNGYLHAVKNTFGEVLRFENCLALHMRVASDRRGFYYLRYGEMRDGEFLPQRDVCHIMQPDLAQEVYGVPYYLAGMDSAELNRSATVFRRRYYDNGSHAGFVVYATDNNLNADDWENLKEQFRKAQNKGNFKNVFVRSPHGDKEGLKLIPISEVAAKDEFLNIKNVSAQDMMTIHRVPPSLMGIVPTAAGGLGDARTAAEVFAANEIVPLQMMFIEVNERMGVELFKFKEYVLPDSRAVAAEQGGKA
ncbi:MAG: phage portal protein [Neisseria sp.]|nr:phage portal protein [Neisseria sp.]